MGSGQVRDVFRMGSGRVQDRIASFGGCLCLALRLWLNLSSTCVLRSSPCQRCWLTTWLLCTVQLSPGSFLSTSVSLLSQLEVVWDGLRTLVPSAAAQSIVPLC